MVSIEDYYNKYKRRVNNSSDFVLDEAVLAGFPREGIYIGELESACKYKVPALLPIDKTCGICFISNEQNKEKIMKSMQIFAMRLALSIPVGLCKYTLFDESGFGNGLVYLAGLGPLMERNHIIISHEELKTVLMDTFNSVADITQQTLGWKFNDKSLIEYNEVAEVPKPYHFIFLTDVPNNYPKETCEILLKIIEHGPKAGVFVVMNLDSEYVCKNDYDFNPLRFLDLMTSIYEKDEEFYIHNIEGEDILKKFHFHLDTCMPQNSKIEATIDTINNNLRNLQNIAVSLSNKLTRNDLWRQDSNDGFRIPIGKKDGGIIQYLELDVEDAVSQSCYHCLLGGTTGSGKTILLHNIICNASWLYSPDELQFLLIDFKEGTEFMVYKDLPHTKILSIESEIDFAKSVFDFLGDEISKRGELFKQVGVQNLRGYNVKVTQQLPRYVLIIDEFQKLFDTNYTLAEEFANNINDIAKRGRSFGINLILSTQGLGGLTISSSTFAEFGLRISMRLNSDMECERILGPGNTAARTLTRKGESVYCPGGLRSENSIYQVAYLSDSKVKEMISELGAEFAKRCAEFSNFNRYIYDGQSYADFSENCIAQTVEHPKSSIRIFIGVPYRLTEQHKSYLLKRENGNNVLLIGKDYISAASIVYYSFLQIIRQSGEDSVFLIFNKFTDKYATEQFGSLNATHIKITSEESDLQKYISVVYEKLESRKQNSDIQPCIVMALCNMYNFKSLRRQAGMPSAITEKLIAILRDGPSYGIHVIAHSDTYMHCVDYSSGIFDSGDLNEFDVKIELKGDSNNRIFENANNSAIVKDYTANIHTSDMLDNEVEKIRVYKI